MNIIQRLVKKNPLKRQMAGGLRAETRPPGQEEGSGRDRPTRGLWDSLSLPLNRAKGMPNGFLASLFLYILPPKFPLNLFKK
jgi:hypothetical protein